MNFYSLKAPGKGVRKEITRRIRIDAENADDFQRERLEAEAKANKLVNDLCKAIELKRPLQSQDPQLEEVNLQKEALKPKTNPEPSNHQVPVLEDSPSSTPSQKPESITTLARATVVMLPEYPPSQVLTSIVVHEVEPTEGPDSEPPTLIQEKEEEVLPTAINDHLLNYVEDTPLEEPVLEEVEPITCPQDTNVQVFEQESIDEELFCMEKPTPLIETCVHNASSEDSDHTFFDSLLDGCDYVCPNDGWSQKSWDELLVSDTEDASMGESMIIIIQPQMDSQPIETKGEVSLAIKARDVDRLRRIPPSPTYTKSPPYILLPPSRREESRILDLDRAKIQTRSFGYSPYQDSDGDNYYEPHGDQYDYDQFGPMCDDQPDPLVEEILRLEQKIFYFDELLFAEGSWYEPPYSRYYTLFAEEQIEANKVAIRERAKLLESVWKEKEFERRLHEGSELMQKMLDDFQRERLAGLDNLSVE
ncbi:unnamed protein product [Cuscuta campestris]|uniref:Uncharacterized protein n=1 Tax=Cuscuta campestris TaxID=132261 RepID=A0A484LXL8_9ASTE|nr:unnamed protein product [Cuscuta campestris]